jgi:hypothetical protein
MSDEEKLFLSDQALLSLVATLATEIVRYGEQESKLFENKHLSEDEVAVLMKSNTLLTVFAFLLINIVKSEDVDSAKRVVEVWITPAIQDMVSIAFAEEIENAARVVVEGIDDIEKHMNKEKNDSPSE